MELNYARQKYSLRIKTYERFKDVTINPPTELKTKTYKLSKAKEIWILKNLSGNHADQFTERDTSMKFQIREAEVVWNRLIKHNIKQNEYDAIIIISVLIGNRRLTDSFAFLYCLRQGRFSEIPLVLISGSVLGRSNFYYLIEGLLVFANINKVKLIKKETK